MKRALALFLGCAAAACGDGKLTIDATLELPSKASLSPLDPNNRLTRILVSIDGADRLDESYVNLAPTETRATFEGYPPQRAAVVKAEGFDSIGNLVAYGRADLDIADEDASVTLQFRRTLAYVAHRAVCRGGCGEGFACVEAGAGATCAPVQAACAQCGAGESCVDLLGAVRCRRNSTRTTAGAKTLYAIDLSTRSLIEKVQIPGTDPRPAGVYPRGGDSVLVTYSDGTNGFVGVLSSSDHSWSKTIQLPRAQELAVGVDGYRYGAVAGGGLISIIDFDEGRVVKNDPLGGRVLDGVMSASTNKAVFITTGGITLIDLSTPENAVALSPGDVTGASGVGLTEDGEFAYITSNADRQVFELDLVTGAMAPNSATGGFSAFVNAATFSERSNTVFALQAGDDGARVFPYDVVRKSGGPAVVGTLPIPSDIAAGPGGRRMIVVSVGTSSASSGLTIVDAEPSGDAEGSTVSYPRDPDDVFREGTLEIRQRYQPYKVTALYGN